MGHSFNRLLKLALSAHSDLCIERNISVCFQCVIDEIYPYKFCGRFDGFRFTGYILDPWPRVGPLPLKLHTFSH